MGKHFVLIHCAWHGGWAIPKAVVFCKADASLPPGAFLGMAQSLGEHRFVEIEGSHEAHGPGRSRQRPVGRYRVA